MKTEAEKLIESKKNQKRYQELLDELGITQAASAELIAKNTRRPCSVRTVRSWLNNSEKRSSRKCPSWPIIVLEDALKDKQSH